LSERCAGAGVKQPPQDDQGTPAQLQKTDPAAVREVSRLLIKVAGRGAPAPNRIAPSRDQPTDQHRLCGQRWKQLGVGSARLTRPSRHIDIRWWGMASDSLLIRHHAAWQPRQAEIGAASGAHRRSARNADAPMNRSREAHHPARPLHSSEGGQSQDVWKSVHVLRLPPPAPSSRNAPVQNVPARPLLAAQVSGVVHPVRS
jgi:hypothetical protein